MNFSGLKLQIATTLTVLLTIAILLGNLIVVMFWQKGMIHSEVEHARAVLLSTDLSNLVVEDNSKIPGALELVCRYAGSHCVGMVYYNGENYVNYGISHISPEIKEMAKTAALSQVEVVQLEGSIWSVFSVGKRYLLISHPVFRGTGKVPHSVLMVLELESIYQTIKEDQKTVFVYLLINIIFLTIVGVFRLIQITVKPVERMVKISEGYHVSDGMIFKGDQVHSEFGQLTMALNSMLMRIELDREELRNTVKSLEVANKELRNTQKEMIRTEKLASVGRLSAGLAHEIGNPIGIVQGYIELLVKFDLSIEERSQFVDRAGAELDRVNKLIRQLLDFAGSSSYELTLIDLGKIFNELLQMMSLKKNSSQIDINLNVKQGEITVKGDEDSIRQVFLNCILNAVDAVDASDHDYRGSISISAEKQKAADNGNFQIQITIKDNGIGIEKEILETVFDPFFTTKEPGKGTGLGLFVSHAIIEAHGGRMWIESEQGKGASVYIVLPEYHSELKSEKYETVDH